MKIPLSPLDDIWTSTSEEASAVGSVPLGAGDGHLMVDDGDPFPLAAQTVTDFVASAAKPVASIATLADYLVNGFWQSNSTIAHHWASSTITYNISGLNSSEQLLALSALQAWSEVANVSFVQVASGANITFTHTGTMQAVTYASWYGTGAIASATVNISTDWVTTDGGANDGKTGIDSYAYQTYIHEIGHALGLGHQGPYNGSASYGTNAIYANDTWQYSIMSYFSEPNYSGSSYRYVITPQMADIYAVGLIYGASTTTRTGNTVYGFNNTASSIYNFSSYTQAPALTIYDSGGNDTLDCSGYSSNQTIDLSPGAFSSVGGLTNNIGIALSTTIENAIGGSGNDTLKANSLGCTLSGRGGNDTLIGGSANDTLVGGVGRDTMTGSGGADTFTFASGESSATSGQHDLITDFTSADRVDVSAMGTFRFLGVGAFDGGTYVLNFSYSSSSGLTTLQGDINGDKVADFAIDFTGNIAFLASYIVGALPPAPVVIESIGVTSLVQSGGNYYLNPVAGGTGPVLQFQGTTVAAGQFTGWTPIGVEVTGTGYEVAWYNSGTGQYTFWYTDSSGKFVTNPTGVVAGSSSEVQSFENSFSQDLNGDGIIGAPVPPPPPPPLPSIESAGVTSLVQSGGKYYLNPVAGGTGPVLQFQGASVSVGQFAGWTPIGAEVTGTGYEVAWYNSGTGQYTFWYTDSSGKFVTNPTGVVTGSSSEVQSFESSFHQDLNGDGIIGPTAPPPSIESAGVTSLVQSGGNYYLNPVAGGTGPVLQFQGAKVTVGQFTGWTPIGAEVTATGYEVAWYNSGTAQYTFWYTDSSGKFVTNPTGPVAGNSSVVQSFESSFHQDLNGDGVISQQPIGMNSCFMGAEQSAKAFDLRPDLVPLTQNLDLHVLDDRLGSPSLASYNGATNGTSFEWLPVPSSDADKIGLKVIAVDFDLFHFY